MTRNFQIVDADAHVNPPATFWAEYLPSHLRDLAPKIEHAEDADYVVFEGSRRKVNLLNAQAGRSGKDFKVNGRLSDARSGGWMPGARLEDMDQDGMDAAVLFGGGPLGTSNEELFIESFHAYNRWLADFCSYAPDRLCGVAYVPIREVDEAIDMMRKAAALGFTCVNIPAFPMSSSKTEKFNGAIAQTLALTGDPDGPRHYGQPEFDPLWKTVVDLGLTLTVHLGARAARWTDPEKFLIDLPMTKVAMAEPIATLIYTAVFDRFPDLKFATIESGVGWFAWFAGYMDATWSKQRFWTKCPIREAPSFYMDQNIYGSFIDERVGILNRNLPGGRNIMWSSDYPHSETTYPNSQAVIDRIFEGIPEEDVAMICGSRAKQLFRVGDGRCNRHPSQSAAAAE